MHNGIIFRKDWSKDPLFSGGVDPTGPYLYEASAEGTTMAKAFTAMGSGSYAAISKLEKEFKLDMTV